jgi:hypothetical protein
VQQRNKYSILFYSMESKNLIEGEAVAVIVLYFLDNIPWNGRKRDSAGGVVA